MNAKDLLDFDKMKEIEVTSNELRYGRLSARDAIAERKAEMREENTQPGIEYEKEKDE